MDEDPAPAFARAPALAIEGLLDYTRPEHIKIYRSGIKQVSDTLFDCEAEGLYYQFLKDVQDRADKMGWTEGILKVVLNGGYGAVSDEVLRGWLLRKQDDHEEGEEITPDELMQAAKDKYDTMVEKGTWNAPTAKEKIVALEAKLESTVKSLNEKVLTDELSKKGKGNRPSGGDKKSKKDSAKSGDHPTKWPKPTKANNEKMGKFKGHMWYWCGKDTGEKCECWRAHKPKECKGLMPATDSAEGKRKTSEVESNRKKSIAKKKLKVAKAYVAEIEKQAAMESETDDDLD